MADVFLSYAREDREVAAKLAAALDRHGFTVWWDREIGVGRAYDEVIEEAATAARCVLVLWSPASVRSNWVKAEAEEGANRGVLIPARLEHVQVPLPYRRYQTADLGGWHGEDDHAGFRGIVAAIRATCDRSASSSAIDTAPSAPFVPGRGGARTPRRVALREVPAAISLLLPTANLFGQALPLRTWEQGGLAYLSPGTVTVLATASCLGVWLWTLSRREDSADRRGPWQRSLGWSLIAAVILLAAFLVIHEAIASDFYYSALGWESGDLRRIAGDALLVVAYSGGFASITRALALLRRLFPRSPAGEP